MDRTDQWLNQIEQALTNALKHAQLWKPGERDFIKMKEIIIEVLSEGAELDKTEKIKDSVVLGAEEMLMDQESVLNASEITHVIYEPKEAAEIHGGLAACSWKCFTEYCSGILDQTKRYKPNSHKGHGYKGGYD